MTYTMYTCHFLAWHWPFIGKGKDWFTQCQDDVTEWDISGLIANWGIIIMSQSENTITRRYRRDMTSDVAMM